MATYRAAYTEACPFTTPEQSHLPEDALIEAAVAEARHARIIGTDGGYDTEAAFRSALSVGEWSDGHDADEDEDDEPAVEGIHYYLPSSDCRDPARDEALKSALASELRRLWPSARVRVLLPGECGGTDGGSVYVDMEDEASNEEAVSAVCEVLRQVTTAAHSA